MPGCHTGQGPQTFGTSQPHTSAARSVSPWPRLAARPRVPNSPPLLQTGGGGGFNVSAPPPGTERPRIVFLYVTKPVSETPWPPTERKLRTKQKTNRQLLAVDHSARASMKNAASCEN